MTSKQSKGEYSVTKGQQQELLRDFIRMEFDRLGQLVSKLGVTAPEQTAREEFQAAEGTKGSKVRDPRLPAPGSTVSRKWKGKWHKVTVLDEGFRYAGRTWPSLSAIAVSIVRPPSGSYNGFEFFGLNKGESA